MGTHSACAHPGVLKSRPQDWFKHTKILLGGSASREKTERGSEEAHSEQRRGKEGWVAAPQLVVQSKGGSARLGGRCMRSRGRSTSFNHILFATAPLSRHFLPTWQKTELLALFAH